MSSLAASAGDPIIAEPLLPAYHGIADRNRGSIPFLVATTFIIITSLVVLVKLGTRIATMRTVGWNDGTMIASIACGIGYTTCTALAVNHGLGQHSADLDTSEIPILSHYYYAAGILFILAIAIAKISVTTMIITIKPNQAVKYASFVMIGIVSIWGIASVIALALQCSPDRWALGPGNGNTCLDQFSLQVGIQIVNIVTDVGIVVLPMLMMRTVQVSSNKKWMVILLFGTRIATPAFSVILLVALHDYYQQPTAARSWQAVIPSVWTTIVMNISIITACLPAIKRFLADWAAGLSKTVISEPLEFEHTAGKVSNSGGPHTGSGGFASEIASRLGLRSASRTQISANSRSRGDKDNEGIVMENRTPRRDPESTEKSDSVKGLTEGVIMHTVDYSVEYEDEGGDNRDGRSSGSGPTRSGYGRPR